MMPGDLLGRIDWAKQRLAEDPVAQHFYNVGRVHQQMEDVEKLIKQIAYGMRRVAASQLTVAYYLGTEGTATTEDVMNAYIQFLSDLTREDE